MTLRLKMFQYKGKEMQSQKCTCNHYNVKIELKILIGDFFKLHFLVLIIEMAWKQTA